MSIGKIANLVSNKVLQLYAGVVYIEPRTGWNPFFDIRKPFVFKYTAFS